MNVIYKYISLLLIASIFACNNDFGDMNVDPEKPTVTNYGSQFTGVSASVHKVGFNQMALRNELLYTYTGLAAKTRAAISLGEAMERPRNDIWGNYYELLKNARKLAHDFETYDGELNTANAEAMLKILVSYATLRTTDVYGDMPYSEAGKAFLPPEEGQILRPAYDTQEDIYMHCLDELKWASDNISLSTDDTWMNFTNFDIFYKGDMAKWQKLANSLLLRHALRISKKAPEKAKSIISDVLDGNKPVIENIDDDFILTRKTADLEENHSNVFNAAESCGLRLGEPVWKLMSSDTDDDTGESIIDPRARIFFETDTLLKWRAAAITLDINEVTPKDEGNYVYSDGRRQNYNYVDPSTGPARDNYYAAFNFDLVNAYNVRVPMLTSSEVHFIKAEIYARSEFGISGDAATSYNKGVEQSCQYWMDVVKNDFPNELGTGEDAWKGEPAPNGSAEDLTMINSLLEVYPYTSVDDIYTQKWLSLFWQPEEAFYMMVRTGKPRTLTTGSNLFRIAYSTNEPIDNAENYKQQLQKMGGEDSPDLKNWWMK